MKNFVIDCILKLAEVIWYGVLILFMIGVALPLGFILLIFSCCCAGLGWIANKLYLFSRGAV